MYFQSDRQVLGDIGGYFSLVLLISSILVTVEIFEYTNCFEDPWFEEFAPKKRMAGGF